MKLTRLSTGKYGTFGEIKLKSGKVIKTLELEWKDNQQKISCIPTGTYECALTQSPKFGQVYTVKNVPNRSHILIHAGNWISDIQGCILLGMSADETRLYDSKKALKLFMDDLNNKPFDLEIIKDY